MIKAGAARDAPVTVGSLRGSLDLRQPAVTALVQRVEQVARSRSPRDGRVINLQLTGEGERRLVHAFKTLTEDGAALVEGFERLGESFRASTGQRPRSPS